MGPGRVVGRRREVGQLRALPRQVVVVQDRRSAGARGRHHRGRRGVERERAQVLDDHEVEGGQGLVHFTAARRHRRIDGQALEFGVNRTGAGHRPDLPSEEAQRGSPLR